MKILASDFDNTIYFENNLEKTTKNVEKIKKFINKGNIFCIITGRNYTDLKQLLNDNNIPYSYLICEDGAKIFNNMDYCLDTILLSKKEIEEIISIIEYNHWNYYLDDGYNMTTNYNDCVKIVINCKEDILKKEIVKKIKEKVDVHVYASRSHINIIHKSVNKEKALKRLLNIENLKNNDLYVIGDNDNDYEMLKTFKGAVIKEHHNKLDDLKKEEFNTLKDYIEELMKN